jgi:hypothetical protein
MSRTGHAATPSFEGRPLQSGGRCLLPMDTLMIECLRCGDVRQVPTPDGAKVDAGECGRCDYVGWASVADLTEKLRRILRDRPPERRRLYAA